MNIHNLYASAVAVLFTVALAITLASALTGISQGSYEAMKREQNAHDQLIFLEQELNRKVKNEQI